MNTILPSLRNLKSPDTFRPKTLVSNLTAGVLIGLMEVFFSISFASLIFTGPLGSHLPTGIGVVLWGSMVMLGGISLLSSQPGIFATIQDVPAVLLAVIAGRLVVGLSGATLLPTVLAAVALSTLLTGLLLVLLGGLRLGGLVRYFPYPVIGGFLAATGWLLVTGAFPIMAGYSLDIQNLPRLAAPGQLILWLPGVVIGCGLFLVTRFARQPMTIPLVIVGSLALFYTVLALTGIHLDRAAAMGLFYSGGVQGPALIDYHLPAVSAFAAVNWGTVALQSGNIAVLMGMTLVGMLLNVSATELVTGREFDLNHELRAAGAANILSGLGGGFVGYHALGTTLVGRRVGARGRLAGLIAAVVILVVMFSGIPILSFIPKALVGGVLLFLGLDFLYDWVFTGWSRFSAAEYGVVLMILVVIVLTDFMTGVAVGLMAMVVMFAISYSRTRVILRCYSCAEVRSMVIRSKEDGDILDRCGDSAQILEMQGFLFFGTANTLVEEVKKRLNDPRRARLEYLVIDFRQVTGIDSSAALGFQKTWQMFQDAANGQPVEMLLTDASNEIQQRLRLKEIQQRGALIRVLDNLDQGLEWCENRLLEQMAHRAPVPGEAAGSYGGIQQAERFPALPQPLDRIPVAYYSLVNLGTEETLIRKGDPADCIYYLLDGQVSIYVDEDGANRERSSAYGAGCVVGEIGMFLGSARTAFVVADQPTRLLKFTRVALQKMYEDDAGLAIALYEFIIQHLAVRMLQGDSSLRALRR